MRNCGCINCCFVVKAPANTIMQHKQRQLWQNQFCFTKLIAVQPSMAEYELTMYQIKVDWLCYHALKSVLLYFFLEILSQTRVSSYMQLNRATYSKLEKSNFDMFYQNVCWAVIYYPICMTNVSYMKRNNNYNLFCDSSFRFSEIWIKLRVSSFFLLTL